MLFKKSERVQKVLGNCDLYTVKLGALAEAMESGIIQGYENNRGSSGTPNARSKKIGEHFKVFGIYTICIARLKDGAFEIVDGHTRLSAFFHARDMGLLSKSEYNVDVPVIVVDEEDKLEDYSILNNTKSHNSNSVLTNADFPLGQLISEIVTLAGVDNPPSTRMKDVSKIPYSFYNQIANVLNTLSNHKKEVDFNDNEGNTWNFVANKSSTEVTNIIKFNPLETVLVPTNVDKKKVAEAIKWVSQYYSYLYDSAFTEDGSRHDSIFDQVKLLVGSPGWFGTLLTCLLSEEECKPIIKTRDAFSFAQTCLEKGSKLTIYTGDLTRNPFTAFTEVNKLLSRRSIKRK